MLRFIRWISGIFKSSNLNTSSPKDIRIAGIYNICGKLGISYWGEQKYVGREMVVAMSSGRDAIYRYADWERARGVDWVWHIYRFVRYVEPGEVLNIVRYG
jgi:hypothetical protein